MATASLKTPPSTLSSASSRPSQPPKRNRSSGANPLSSHRILHLCKSQNNRKNLTKARDEECSKLKRVQIEVVLRWEAFGASFFEEFYALDWELIDWDWKIWIHSSHSVLYSVGDVLAGTLKFEREVWGLDREIPPVWETESGKGRHPCKFRDSWG